jgi:hypothetical protein
MLSASQNERCVTNWQDFWRIALAERRQYSGFCLEEEKDHGSSRSSSSDSNRASPEFLYITLPLHAPARLKSKGKVHSIRRMKAQRGRSGIALLINRSDRLGWMWNARPRPLYPWKETWYRLYRRLDGHKGGPGRVRKISRIPRWLYKFFQISQSKTFLTADLYKSNHIIRNKFLEFTLY